MMNKKIPSPKRGASVKEKLEFYDRLIEAGLDVEELKLVRNRIYRIDTQFQDREVICLKYELIVCIKEMISEG